MKSQIRALFTPGGLYFNECIECTVIFHKKSVYLILIGIGIDVDYKESSDVTIELAV